MGRSGGPFSGPGRRSFREHELAPLVAISARGRILSKTGLSGRRERMLTELVTKWPHVPVVPQGRSLRGHCYFQLKQPQKAIEDLNAFLAANADGCGPKSRCPMDVGLGSCGTKATSTSREHAGKFAQGFSHISQSGSGPLRVGVRLPKVERNRQSHPDLPNLGDEISRRAHWWRKPGSGWARFTKANRSWMRRTRRIQAGFAAAKEPTVPGAFALQVRTSELRPEGLCGRGDPLEQTHRPVSQGDLSR